MIKEYVKLYTYAQLLDYGRPEQKYRLKKLLWFIRNEGLYRTMRKVFVTRMSKYVNDQTLYVVAKFINKSETFVTVGVELNKVLYPLSEATFKVDESNDSLDYISNTLRSIQSPSNRREALSMPSLAQFVKEYKLRACDGLNPIILIGCGSYAWTHILPNIPKNWTFYAAIDLNPALAYKTKEKFQFEHALTDYKQILDFKTDAVVIIAGYHSMHFEAVRYFYSLRSTNWIFVEKPPCISSFEALELANLRKNTDRIYIGYNRPFSKLYGKVKKELIGDTEHPKFITMSINEVNLKDSHWYYWDDQMTRITGNLVHWIDIVVDLVEEAEIEKVEVLQSHSTRHKGDDVIVSISFRDGSLATMIGTDQGNKLRGVQEWIEIRVNDKTITIEDFSLLKILKNSKSYIYKYRFRDKGHKTMYKKFVYDCDTNEAMANMRYTNNRLIKKAEILDKIMGELNGKQG